MRDADYINKILTAKRPTYSFRVKEQYLPPYAYNPHHPDQKGLPRLLDLYCGAGGATKGYQVVGFHTTGVEINVTISKHYVGDELIVQDALQYLRENISFIRENFHAIHASPPCQGYSAMRMRNTDNPQQYPKLIEPTRELLDEIGLPYVIENVKYAPLIKTKRIILCLSMFGVESYRDRSFEVNFPVVQPPHPRHVYLTANLGDPPRKGEFIQTVGGHPVGLVSKVMGIDWMNRDELSEAVPPVFTSYIGAYLLKHIEYV